MLIQKASTIVGVARSAKFSRVDCALVVLEAPTTR